MTKKNVVNLYNKENKQTHTVDESQTILFINGEKIEFDGLLLAGETTDGERVVISGGTSLDQTILLKEELVFAVNEQMRKRFNE